ncbi:hypothetical protein LIER_40955 [Lithospermum erythrorhizon]|uniref:Uncharacterized protein n=1 Tax=Lithospermum erythrorhizon TaxID=34254 RepID=A0AAV3R3H5_LITER
MVGDRVGDVKWVAQLIRGGKWNESLVREIAGDEQARTIMAIRISLVPIRDKLVWHHTKCGNYTTFSGYLCAKEMKKNGDLRKSAEGGGGGGGIMVRFPLEYKYHWTAVDLFQGMVDRLKLKIGTTRQARCTTFDCLHYMVFMEETEQHYSWRSLGDLRRVWDKGHNLAMAFMEA